MWGVSRRSTAAQPVLDVVEVRVENVEVEIPSTLIPPISPCMSSASFKNFPVLELLTSLVTLKLRYLGPDEDPCPTFEIMLRDDTRLRD